jgi:uncharacterized protein
MTPRGSWLWIPGARLLARPGMTAGVIAALCLLFASVAFTLDFPVLTGRVVDQAGVMSAASKSDVEAKSKALEDKSGIQLVVATVKSLQGSDIETYANQLARFWKLGEANKNNGVLLLVAPNEHKVRIEVGYGLEGTLTDALSSVIIASAILPRFKTNDYSGGIERGVDGIISVLSGDSAEWQPKPSVRNDKAEAIDGLLPLLFTLFLIFFVWYLIRNAGGGRPPGPGSRSGPIIFPGGWGGSSDWGGGGGGGFGGGFSGGGGSFGGGGASGSW